MGRFDPGGHLPVHLRAQGLPHIRVAQASADQQKPGGAVPHPVLCGRAHFEHLHQPFVATSQIALVLKPGDALVWHTPFMHPFHGVPRDCFRYTHQGARAARARARRGRRPRGRARAARWGLHRGGRRGTRLHEWVLYGGRAAHSNAEGRASWRRAHTTIRARRWWQGGRSSHAAAPAARFSFSPFPVVAAEENGHPKLASLEAGAPRILHTAHPTTAAASN